MAVDCVSRAEVSSRVAAVVLENTFTSIPDMAKVLFSGVRFLARLPHWCHKNKVSDGVSFVSHTNKCKEELKLFHGYRNGKIKHKEDVV